MKSPLHYRRQVPFFYDKSEEEIKLDPYERYDPTVIRQCALHLCDTVWGVYPQQAAIDFILDHLPTDAGNITEIGCGVGRWIADFAKRYSNAQCWGLDFSYQMLRQAAAYWLQGQPLSINLSNKGYPDPILQDGFQLPNLQFGLAKAAALPFPNDSQDILTHSFLIDRLPDPVAAIKECFRILRPGGIMCFVSPLNFQNSNHWSNFYPPVKLYHSLSSTFDIIDWREGIIIKEPLDLHGNEIHWNCLGVIARKK
jgi:SAM-dependent methyltransferase